MSSTEIGLGPPFISLEKALERARRVYELDPSGTKPATADEIRAAWGLGPKSSNYPQTVNALKGYGLIDATRATAVGVMLTNEAQEYFGGEDAEKSGLLEGFALAHPALRACWDAGLDASGDETPGKRRSRRGALNGRFSSGLLKVHLANFGFVTGTPVESAGRAAVAANEAVPLATAGVDDIQTTYANGRIRLVADIAAKGDGLSKLKDVLDKYADIANILGR